MATNGSKALCQALMALAFATGTTVSASALAEVPETVVTDLTDLEPNERARFFRMLALHPSSHVRENVAMELLHTADTLTPDVETALGVLIRDPHPGVRWTVISWFGSFVKRLNGMDQTALIGDWALSENPTQRLAVACALPRCTYHLADEALNLLLEDEDPAVRTAAQHASRLIKA